jgi:hypothetical protein
MLKPLLAIVLCFALALPAFAGKQTSIPPKEARQHIGKRACVAAHIYRVVDAKEGVHFLDTCSPETADKDCHFFILSVSKDKKSVEYLHNLAGRNIEIRGPVHAIQGHAEMVLSDPKQIHIVSTHSRRGPHPDKDFSAGSKGRAFSPRNGRMGQHGVHYRHRGK